MSTAAAWQNWSRLERATPDQLVRPASADEVVDVVRRGLRDGRRVKMTGTGHSFTGIAAPVDIHLAPQALRGIVEVDRASMTVTVRAGTPLHELNASLTALGLSLHNMGDIADQTVAGAIQTGTHGTGGVKASLSDQVAGVELVDGTGELRRFGPGDAEFDAVRLGLGALGVLISVTFEVEPLFGLEAHERPIGWSEALDSFEAIAAEAHHAEMYWFPHTDHLHLKVNHRIPSEDPTAPLGRLRGWLDDDFFANTAFGALQRVGDLRPTWRPRINELCGRLTSDRTYSDVPHRVFTSPRRVVFREMEYAVPREVGVAALRACRSLIERNPWQISLPVEIRTAPADDLMLSAASGRDVMYLAFHVNARTDHRAYFTPVEALLREFGGRPHWGKLHTRSAPDLATAYPRWAEFLAIRDRLDPDRIFTNPYLDRVLG